MAKQLMFDDEGRRKVLTGLQKLAQTVKVTLGPSGRNVIIDKKVGAPEATSDGVSISKEVELEDPFENAGAQIIRQAATQTNDDAGDGTTTSTVLARAILRESQKFIASGVSPIELQRGIDIAAKEVISNLMEMTQPVTTAAESAPAPDAPLAEPTVGVPTWPGGLGWSRNSVSPAKGPSPAFPLRRAQNRHLLPAPKPPNKFPSTSPLST